MTFRDTGTSIFIISIILFVITYAAIAFEHPLKINKSASALIGGGLMWTVFALGSADPSAISYDLSETLVSTAQIVFSLMGAMTIVEVIDTHKGFDVVTSRIKTSSLPRLLVLVSVVTFFLSAILDNLTTTIVMVSLLSKLLKDRQDRLFFAGLVVIAANSGGAWSPIGDVTTTMLWIGGQITSLSIIQSLFLPFVVSLLVPLVYCVWLLRGRLVVPPDAQSGDSSHLMPRDKTSAFERNTMFFWAWVCWLPSPRSKLSHICRLLLVSYWAWACCGWWAISCTRGKRMKSAANYNSPMRSHALTCPPSFFSSAF
jgi:Na+/H+ antiporter NhaD/arsenite permease-like protein